MTINCAAIPEQLLESELFGYVRGAFSGADPKGRMGKFELANGGSLFLDEIGDMPLHLQAKLLRVLQEKAITRVGSNNTIEIDVRIIAATNKNIHTMVENHQFREDLLSSERGSAGTPFPAGTTCGYRRPRPVFCR